jgi:hypothetical protein
VADLDPDSRVLLWRIVGLAVAAVLLVGCDDAHKLASVDQCKRVELFQACLRLLPKGPDRTVYNDWDEVVSECESAAYYQSIRPYVAIKPECRSK